jgi:hypothetical protein
VTSGSGARRKLKKDVNFKRNKPEKSFGINKSVKKQTQMGFKGSRKTCCACAKNRKQSETVNPKARAKWG